MGSDRVCGGALRTPILVLIVGHLPAVRRNDLVFRHDQARCKPPRWMPSGRRDRRTLRAAAFRAPRRFASFWTSQRPPGSASVMRVARCAILASSHRCRFVAVAARRSGLKAHRFGRQPPSAPRFPDKGPAWRGAAACYGTSWERGRWESVALRTLLAAAANGRLGWLPTDRRRQYRNRDCRWHAFALTVYVSLFGLLLTGFDSGCRSPRGRLVSGDLPDQHPVPSCWPLSARDGVFQ